MSSSSIAKKEKLVLRYLIKNGVAWYSKLCEEGTIEPEKTISNKTVLKWLHELESLRLIKAVEKKQEAFMGRPKTLYGLTLMGLCYAFDCVDGELENYVPMVKNRFKEALPLVFGEWGYFRKQGVEGIATKHLLNVLKICGSEYDTLLRRSEDLQRKGKSPYSGFYEEIREKWMHEEQWARRITDLFLFHGLKPLSERTFRGLQGTTSPGILSYGEKQELNEAFTHKEELRLYRLLVESHEPGHEKKNFFRVKLHIPKYFESAQSPTAIGERIVERMVFKLRGRDPYQEVVDAIRGEDYYQAALKLTNLYVGFPFESAEEATSTVPSFLKNLVEMTCPEKTRAKIIAMRESGKDYGEDLKKGLDKIGVELLAAQYFYKHSLFKIWDLTVYCIKPRKKRIKMLEEHPDKARASALKWVQSIQSRVGR